MNMDDLRETIAYFKKQGFNEMQISIAFAQMYLNDECNYNDLEIILPVLGMKIADDFKNKTDEERKATLREMLKK